MSSCEGCYEAFGDNPNPHSPLCAICIRNPKYPTMKMPEKVIIEGIELSVPQDMYVARDRQNFEQKQFMRKLAEILKSLNLKEERKREKPPLLPTWYPEYPTSWELYWDWVYAKKRLL